jgi:hypothetical protein
METFYARLAAGGTVAGSLRDAQATIRSDPAMAHPFFWAGFVTVGAGETKISLVRRAHPGIPAFIGAAALAILAWAGFAARPRRVTVAVMADPGERPMG